MSPSNWCKSSEISWRSLYCWNRIRTQHNTAVVLDPNWIVSILNTIDNTRVQKQHLTDESATTNYQEIKVENLQKKSSCMTGGSFHRRYDSTSELLHVIEVFVTFCRLEVPSPQCSSFIQNTNEKYQIQTYQCCTKPASPKQPRKTPYRSEKLQPPWSSEIW